MKKLILAVTTIGLISACAKKKDDGAVVAPAPPPVADVTKVAKPAEKQPNVGAPAAPEPPVASGSRAPTQPIQVFGKTADQLPAEAKLQYSTTADDKLSFVLSSMANTETDQAVLEQNLLRAKLVSAARLITNKNGMVEVVIEVPEMEIIKEKDESTKVDPKKANSKKNKTVKVKKPIMQHQIILRGTKSSSGVTQLATVNALGHQLKASASLKCYDADGGCDVSVVTIHFGASKAAQQVQIIFRTTSFNYDVKIPKTTSGSAAYSKLVGLFMNSRYTNVLQGTESNLLKIRSVDTYEVINGRSAGSVTMVSAENEIMIFRFSLLKDLSGDSTLAGKAVDKMISFEDGYTLSKGDGYSTRLSDSMEQVELVSNDGRGELGFQIKMKTLENGSQDSLELTLTRTQKKIKY